MKPLATLGLLMLTAYSASAQTTSNVVTGPGAASCGKYLEYAKLNDPAIFVTWTQGFLSGANVAEKNTGKPWLYIPDAETVKAYLDRHCSEKPLSSPAEGAALMYFELRQRQKVTSP